MNNVLLLKQRRTLNKTNWRGRMLRYTHDWDLRKPGAGKQHPEKRKEVQENVSLWFFIQTQNENIKSYTSKRKILCHLYLMVDSTALLFGNYFLNIVFIQNVLCAISAIKKMKENEWFFREGGRERPIVFVSLSISSCPAALSKI